MNMTLESLMEGLEKQAGLVDMAKQASSDPKADEKHEKEEDKKEAEAKKDVSKAKSDIEKSEEDFASLKKMNEKEEAKDKKEQTKEASAAGADFANEIMQKVASLQITTTQTKENEMNKQASDAGKALADALLEKLANAGDQTTVAGIPDGVAPNKNQIDNAQLVAEQDVTIKPMPGAGGSINQIFDSIVADALGQGAASFDQVHTQGVSAQEGAAEAQGTPNQVYTVGVEKTAAVMSLVNSGVDFDSAVDMVKAAAEQIEAEEAEQVKQAAFADLVGRGVDFELAAALVKSAGAVGNAAAGAKKWLQNEGVKASVGAENVAFGARNLDKGIAARGLKQLAGNRLVQGGAAATAVGGAGYALGREKQAAVSALCEAGVDFDSAVDLVQSKSQEIYGA